MGDRTARFVARLVVRGYPAAFRSRHGNELVDTLAHSISAVRQQHPFMWFPLAVMNALRDLWRARFSRPRGLHALARTARAGRGPWFAHTFADVRMALRRWRTRPVLAI